VRRIPWHYYLSSPPRTVVVVVISVLYTYCSYNAVDLVVMTPNASWRSQRRLPSSLPKYRGVYSSARCPNAAWRSPTLTPFTDAEYCSVCIRQTPHANWSSQRWFSSLLPQNCSICPSAKCPNADWRSPTPNPFISTKNRDVCLSTRRPTPTGEANVDILH